MLRRQNISECRDRMHHAECRDGMHPVSTKSRRDDTLLTVDFNLRKRNISRMRPSPAGTILASHLLDNKVSSHAGLRYLCASIVRRLKPTVNKVTSLRDLPFSMDWLRDKK